MKHQNVFATIMVVLVIFSPPSHAQNISQSYRNEDYGFTVHFPQDWIIKEGLASGTIVKAVHRDKLGKVAMVIINAQELAEGEANSMQSKTPEVIFEEIKRQFARKDVIIMLLDSGVTYLNGEYAIWHKYRMKMPQVMEKIFLTYNVPRK